jgi:hypothetical protein
VELVVVVVVVVVVGGGGDDDDDDAGGSGGAPRPLNVELLFVVAMAVAENTGERNLDSAEVLLLLCLRDVAN